MARRTKDRETELTLLGPQSKTMPWLLKPTKTVSANQPGGVSRLLDVSERPCNSRSLIQIKSLTLRNPRRIIVAERIVAVALLTQPELQGLGAAFDRAWPIEEAPCFTGLLQAIDEADRRLWRGRRS